jgi:branched-chain amino acid transport system ATP-binding protein
MLKVTDLTTFYGSIQALKGVSLEVIEREIVTVVGPNGAGKSTLLRTISGLQPATSGKIMLLDRDITGEDPHSIARMGVTHVLQGRQIFSDMTVEQNLRIGAYHRPLSKTDLNYELEQVYSYFPILKERKSQKGGTLSGGEQVMLAIGRLLILDEPSLGLAPRIVDVVFETLLKLNNSGQTIILVEQNAELAFDLAQRCYLMELGCIVLEGTVKEIRKSDAVIDLYLGQNNSDTL